MFGSAHPSYHPHQESEPLSLLVQALIREQKRQRRWSVFKWIFIALFFFVGWGASHPNLAVSASKPHAAVVTIQGVIGEKENADPNAIAVALRHAFESPSAKGVILKLNSPGGSAVAAHQIYHLIKKLRASKPDIPIYSVVSDLCASACYYIASATDQIYANPASIVGSIGVLIDGFGFVGAMEKMGIERRLLTAGEHKGFLDSFSTLKDSDRAFVKTMLDGVHQDFIAHVKSGRGDRLKSDPLLFSGLAWSGLQAQELGLIDGFGTAREVSEESFKTDLLLDYTQKESPLDRLMSRLSASFAKEWVSQLNVRAEKIQAQML